MAHAQLLEALNRASTFDLFLLNAMIDRELESPERIGRIKAALTVGQKLSYFDCNSNSLRHLDRLSAAKTAKLSKYAVRALDVFRNKPIRLRSTVKP